MQNGKRNSKSVQYTMHKNGIKNVMKNGIKNVMKNTVKIAKRDQ
jgi:hypothetical protein